ncbi:MAG TPA: hypothetical protein PKC40_09640 [Saprospiraceae bacterium]|nr:hypothetical protein [Saprospiraceae bacterium]
MKNYFLVSTSMIFILLAGACKKEKMNDCQLTDQVMRIAYYYGSDSASLNFVYDQTGLLSKTVSVKLDSSEADNEYFMFDSNGKLVEMGSFPKPHSPDYKNIFEYENGTLKTWKQYSSITPGAPIQLIQTTEYEYDGNLPKGFKNFQNGVVTDFGTFTHDVAGKKVLIERFYASNTVRIERYEYTFGNLANPLYFMEPQIEYYPNTQFLPVSKTAFDVVTLQQIGETSFEFQTNAQGQAEKAKIFQDGQETGAYRFYFDCN